MDCRSVQAVPCLPPSDWSDNSYPATLQGQAGADNERMDLTIYKPKSEPVILNQQAKFLMKLLVPTTWPIPPSIIIIVLMLSLVQNASALGFKANLESGTNLCNK
ncbi:hypothetical protein GOODEAATRI_010449 [Goodea atripinnis]|uniref:Uncharacterized protein n=1 Tax=Goodea atripinnis TaxID=208336 RepID=A0ABV0N2E0_9TELE